MIASTLLGRLVTPGWKKYNPRTGHDPHQRYTYGVLRIAFHVIEQEEHRGEMTKVAVKIIAEDQDIVEIDNDEFTNEWAKCLVHNSHECTWSVR